MLHYHDGQGSLPPDYATYDIPQQNSTADGKADLSWMVLLLPYIEQDGVWKATLDAYDIDLIDYHNPPHVGLTAVIPMYTCPSDPRTPGAVTDMNGITSTHVSYIGVAGGSSRDGIFGVKTGCRLSQISDGTSNTLMVGERPPPNTYQADWWYMVRDEGLTFNGEPPGPNRSINVAYPNTGYVMPWGCVGPVSYGPGTPENACDRMHFWSFHSGGANFLFADGSARFISYAAQPIMPSLGTKAGGESIVGFDY